MTSDLPSGSYCQTYKAWTLTFSFNFPFSFLFDLFFYCKLRIRVRVTLQSHCHTSVTSDNTVTVIFTSHEVIEKNIEGFRKITSYNI